MRAFRIVPGFVLVAAACGGGPSVPQALPWIEVGSEARLYSDNASGLQDSVRIVILDDARLREVWGRATSRQMSPPPLPAIDFENEMVLAVGAGRMTVEDRIRVDSVVVREEVTTTGERDVFSVIVRVIEGCGQFDTAAYPVEIVRVRRFDGPVRFVERRSRVEGCGVPEAGPTGAQTSRTPTSLGTAVGWATGAPALAMPHRGARAVPMPVDRTLTSSSGVSYSQ